MLPQKHRIQRKDFDTYFKKGKVLRSASFTLRVGFLPEDTPTQTAVVVSKKVAKKAADRHTIKRRIYTALRKLLPSLPPLSIIVITHKGGNWEYASLEREITKALEPFLPGK